MGRGNLELIEFHRYMSGIRKRCPAFRNGSLKALAAGDGYIAYGRFQSAQRAGGACCGVLMFLPLGWKLWVDSPTNQVFLVLSHAQIERLRQDFAFEITGHVDDEHEAGRFVCSWATKEEAVDALIAAL